MRVAPVARLSGINGSYPRALSSSAISIFDPISLWETLLLAERGQIELDVSPKRWVQAALREFPIRDATLTREVATLSRAVDLRHEDPADRFIAASAIVYDLALVSADERLLRSKKYRTVPNADR